MNGGKPFAGPMLVLQGTDDPNTSEPVTSKSVNQTCELYLDSQLQYIVYNNITHVPVLYAGIHTWLDWVHDRFAGIAAPTSCSKEILSPPRGISGASFAAWSRQNWCVEFDEYSV